MSTAPSIPPALITINELSEYVNIPVSTLYSWRSRGLGPRAVKLGGQLRWRLTDVDAWIADSADIAS